MIRKIHTAVKRVFVVAVMMMATVMAWADGENVAKIDETHLYTTLQAAIDAAGTIEADVPLGTSITLLANVTESVNVPEGKTVTINLDGHSITHSGETEVAVITNAGTLTITGSSEGTNTIDKIVNTGTISTALVTITELQTSGAGNVSQTSGTITTLNVNGDVTGTISVTNALCITIDAHSVSVLTVNSCTTTITGSGTIANLYNNGGTITLAGGVKVIALNTSETSSVTVTSATVTELANSGTTTITGEGITIITGTGTVCLGGDIANTITAEGVTIDLKGHIATAITAAEGKDLTIAGTAENNTVTTLTAGAGSTLNIDSGTIANLDAKENATINIKSATLPTNITANATAAFNFRNITSENISKALEYANVSTANFVLTGDIATEVSISDVKTITLDLKDHSINSLTNVGTLTLSDSGTNDTGAVTNLNNSGTLTVQSGKVTTLQVTAGNTTIKDGTIGTLNVSGESTVTIDAGTITTIESVNNNVTINGGVITTFPIDQEHSINFNVHSSDEMSQAMRAVKSAIKLESDITGNYVIDAENNVSLTMNGKSLNGAAGSATITNNGWLTIVNSNGSIYAADGQVAINNNDYFTMLGAHVASANLNGFPEKQNINNGTLDAAILPENKVLNVNGGIVTALTAENGSSVKVTSGNVTTITTDSGKTVHIQGTGFKNLAGAGTYQLAENVTSNINIPTGANVTLALNEKTLAATSLNTVTVASDASLTVSGTGVITAANDNVYAIESEGTVTVADGTIASVNAKAGTMTISGGNIAKVADNGGIVNLNGGTVTALTGVSGAGSIKLGADMTSSYTVLTGADLMLNLGAHTMNELAVNEGASLNINGDATNGKIATLTNKGNTTLTTGNITTVNSNTGTLNVAGGTIETTTSTGTMNVTGGTVTTLNANEGNTTVSGGTVSTLNAGDGTNNSNVTVSGTGKVTTVLNAKTKSTVTLESGSVVAALSSEDGAKVIIKNGATIGENRFGSDLDFSQISSADALKNAVTIVKSGSLTLGADITLSDNLNIPAGANMTINPNNKTLSGSTITIASDASDGGKLTIKGTGTVNSNITNGGTLNVGGANVSGAVTNKATMCVTAGTVSGNITSTSELNISGGNVTNASVTAGTMEVTGGISSTLAVSGGNATVSNGTITNLNLSGGTTTIGGGMISNLSTTADAAVVTLNSGNVATFTINGGTVTVEAEGIVTTYAGAGGVNVTLPSYIISDDNAGSYPTRFKTASARYTRQNVTAWGTICLPFSLTKSPHSNITLYQIDNIAENTLTLTAQEIGSEIQAGTPFIFGCSTTGEIAFESGEETAKADVNISESAILVESASTSDNLKLKGYINGTVLHENTSLAVTACYYINGDKFHQAAKKLTVPAYRAIIVDGGSSGGARPSVLNISTGGTTAVDSLLAGDSEILGYYDQNGVLHSAPVNGVNIVKMANGKSVKLIIK